MMKEHLQLSIVRINTIHEIDVIRKKSNDM